MSMQLALEVNESTADQLPSTTTEPTNSVQQTRSSEGLTAPSQPNATSAAEQQQLMNFLYSESSGSVYTGQETEPSTTLGSAVVRLGVGTLLVVLAVGLAIVCQRLFNRFNPPTKTASKQKSRKKK